MRNHCGPCFKPTYPASILYKSSAGRYRPVRVADGPITARYRFMKNAYWVDTQCLTLLCNQKNRFILKYYILLSLYIKVNIYKNITSDQKMPLSKNTAYLKDVE